MNKYRNLENHEFVVDCERTAHCAFCGQAPEFYKHRKPWKIADAASQVPVCADPEHEHDDKPLKEEKKMPDSRTAFLDALQHERDGWKQMINKRVVRDMDERMSATEARAGELQRATVEEGVSHAMKAKMLLDAAVTGPQGKCDTTVTERFAYPDCKCDTYPGNLGPCQGFVEGSKRRGAQSRCVFCDHGVACHKAVAELLKQAKEQK
jgi:hypothetical protein